MDWMISKRASQRFDSGLSRMAYVGIHWGAGAQAGRVGVE